MGKVLRFFGLYSRHEMEKIFEHGVSEGRKREHYGAKGDEVWPVKGFLPSRCEYYINKYL